MAFETFDLDNLDRARREAAAKSLRAVAPDELTKFSEELFPFAGDPWAEIFHKFVSDNRGSTFHHAVMSDGVNLLYCRDQDKGMWFLPGSGMGPLQARGCQLMKEIIEGKR